jgi:hypothetical protein
VNSTITVYSYGCGSELMAEAVARELHRDGWEAVGVACHDVVSAAVVNGSRQVAHIDAIISVFVTRDLS